MEESIEQNFVNAWDKFKYPYLTLLILSTLMAVYLSTNVVFKSWMLHLGQLEYLGAYFAGMIFVSSFTVPISIALIIILASDVHPILLALIGGVGALTGDLILFRYFKDHLGEELSLLFGKSGTRYIKSVIKSKYISWTLPIIGAFIIASPLPDELGISLLGLSKISDTKFALISYLSNFFGILAIASVAQVI